MYFGYREQKCVFEINDLSKKMGFYKQRSVYIGIVPFVFPLDWLI